MRISGNNAGYTVFRGRVKGTGYPLQSPVSLSLPLPCVYVCHHITTGVYFLSNCKWTSSFKSVGAPVQSTTGSRDVRISGSNAGYTMFRGSVKGTGYPLHSPVSPSPPLPCVTVCHHISTGHSTLYKPRNVTGYPLHSPVSPSVPFPCINLCHHISTGVYPKRSTRVLGPHKALYIIITGVISEE